jgi:hypothetical protein
MGRNSVAGIATSYGLDSPGIESRCGRDFPQSSRHGRGVHSASCTMGAESFLWVKQPGRGVDQPP